MFERLFMKIPRSPLLKRLRYIFWPAWHGFLRIWRFVVRLQVTMLYNLPVGSNFVRSPNTYYRGGSNAENSCQEIPRGRVWGLSGAVITPKNVLLLDLSKEGDLLPWEHPALLRRKFQKPQFLKGRTAVLAVTSGHVYFHWLSQVLPRISLIEAAGISRDSIDQWVVNKPIYESQWQMLAMLGIPREHCLVTDLNFHIEAEWLVAPSIPSDGPEAFVWISRFLRESFLGRQKNLSPDNPKRIYISRSDASHRFLLNEREVLPVVERYGFVPVELDTMPFAEQVGLFANAEAVLGVHGGGLSNIVFCPSGTKVIEIFSPKYCYECYHYVAQSVSLRYEALFGIGSRPARSMPRVRVLGEDIRLDLKTLEDRLKNI